MAVRMELARIMIRELNDYQLIELREVAPVNDDGAQSPEVAPQHATEVEVTEHASDEQSPAAKPHGRGKAGPPSTPSTPSTTPATPPTPAAAAPTPPPPATHFSQVEGGRSFPIVIGLPEAHAIERRLKGITIKRPQTHDLLANVITALGGTLESICIHDLAEHTFYAQLNIRDKAGKLVKVDSRPSDAIALGIAGNVSIFVEEHVLDAAQNDGNT